MPVNNRTVLHLLEALQMLQIKMPGGGPAEARRLSFRALDIEQIGHVYEGLLDHTAKRATEPILGLTGTRAKEPEIPLAELERKWNHGIIGTHGRENAEASQKGGFENVDTEIHKDFLKWLKEETGRSETALKKSLSSFSVSSESSVVARFRTACQSDDALWSRVQPLAGLIRLDNFGYPVVIPAGSVFVTAGTDRRSSGTHYTPRVLTEPIVQYTLEPLVYVGPAEGWPKSEWKLKSAKELLDLKICDMACGSGAFLVQVCRYLAARLLEAWDEIQQANPGQVRYTPEGLPSTGQPGETLIPDDVEERRIYALRLVSQRCIYGVDINPLAVEMCKLSLWLLTLAKDKPFEFLDHNIRCGDSLVGIHDLDQLSHFSLKPNDIDQPLFSGPWLSGVDDAIALRLKLEDLPSNSVEDVERQEKLLKEANEKIARLRCAADLLVSAEFWGESAKDKLERVRHAAVKSGHYVDKGPTEEFEQVAAKERRGQKMFHWPLEFPEVIVKRGGFDGFVGNPPFQGGKRITGSLGVPYRSYILQQVAGGLRGNADLCAYFVLRAGQQLRNDGAFGFLATNTLSEGDTREIGLDQLAAQGITFNRAIRSQQWPGSASLEVAIIWGYFGAWQGATFLDNHLVNTITPYLTEREETTGPPHRLAEASDKAFIGTVVYGQGFVLTHEEAETLKAVDPRSKDVIFPYINGDDLNSAPTQCPTRAVISFGDLSESEARAYAACFQIIEEKVKPYRMTVSEKAMREKWWLHQRSRPALYRGIASNRHVLLKALTSKHHAFAFVSTGWIYDQTSPVFAFDDWSSFGVLQSSVHEAWALAYGASLETRPRYTPSDCFETFPFPLNIHSAHSLEQVAQEYHEHRKQIMKSTQRGLTDMYNRFHNADTTDAAIQKLRELHVEMDQAVAAAYRWNDLELGHDFHATKQGVRFTISEAARREVLQRLLKLNHERYAEEVKQGLHGKKKGGAGLVTPAAKKKAASKPKSATPMLFDMEEDG